VFCVQGDVGVVGGYARDIGKEHTDGDKDLGTEKDGIYKVYYIGVEVDDSFQGAVGKEVQFQFGVAE